MPFSIRCGDQLQLCNEKSVVVAKENVQGTVHAHRQTLPAMLLHVPVSLADA